MRNEGGGRAAVPLLSKMPASQLPMDPCVAVNVLPLTVPAL